VSAELPSGRQHAIVFGHQQAVNVDDRAAEQQPGRVEGVLDRVGGVLAPSLLDRFLAKTNVSGRQSTPHDPPEDKHNTCSRSTAPRSRRTARPTTRPTCAAPSCGSPSTTASSAPGAVVTAGALTAVARRCCADPGKRHR
jgi:hypothetical protein